MARTKYKLIIRDDNGPVFINARVYPRLVGTAIALSDAFPTATGGIAAESFVTNAQGEAEFWTDAFREDIDVYVTDNAGAAFPPGGLAGTFPAYTETVQVPAPTGTFVRLQRENVNATELPYTADKTGDTDSSDTLEAALTAADVAKVSGSSTSTPSLAGSTIPSGSTPCIYLPASAIRTDAALPLPSYVRFVADGAILFSPGVNDLLTSIDYQSLIQGLRFRGGGRHLYYQTANVDRVLQQVVDCYFDGGTSQLELDATSASTLLVVDRFLSSVSAANGSRLLREASGDKVVMQNGWVSWPSDYCWDVIGGLLELDHVLGVPTGGAGQLAWVLLGGSGASTGGAGIFKATNTRFGGENPTTIVESHSGPQAGAPTAVIVERCQVHVGSKPAMKFYDIPNLVVARNNDGFTAGWYFEFLATIPATTKRKIGSTAGPRFDVDRTWQNFPFTESSDQYSAAAMLHSLPEVADATISTSNEQVWSISPPGAAGFGLAETISNMGVGSGANLFGAQQRTYTAGGDGASFTTDYTLALDAFAAGDYTFSVVIEVVGGPCEFNITTADKNHVVALTQGRHVLNFPFRYDSTVNLDKRIAVNGKHFHNGDEVKVWPYRVFKGHVRQNKGYAELWGSAAPTAGVNQVGDRVMNSAPAGATPIKYWYCTAAGTPGTWQEAT